MPPSSGKRNRYKNANGQKLDTTPSIQTGDAEFDENGTELHRDARVWNVYVKEADEFDAELAQEWNDSTEVILTKAKLAALFSAISTAFLIESSKLLQEDPADVSKQTLVAISQTLLTIANGTQAPGSITTSPSIDTSTDFAPPYAAVCVNILWFLSLSLSIATSFIAMMAKDWCHAFLSGRTGHPFSQTCRRQQKWDMIERWKMKELLSVLPSLMHAALVLFAVGLGIHLWNLHTGVAVPVIVVTSAAIGFYVLTSIGAIVLDSFPYPTIVSRLCRGKGIVRQGYEYAYWFILAIASYPPLQLLFVPVLCGLTGVMLVAWLCLNTLLMACFPFEFVKPHLDHGNQYVMASGYLPLQVLAIPPLSFARLFVCHPAARIARWSRDSSSWLNSKLLLVAYRALLSILSSMRTWKDLNSKSVPQEDNHSPEQNNSISRALAWLIVNCEVPKSVDTALQAIAGATERVSRQPLVDCNATLEILRRLASSNLYREPSTRTERTVSLYARALEFLGNPVDSGLNDADQGKEGALEGLFWNLHLAIEKEVAALIVNGDFKPTQSNLGALRIGSTAASTSLKILNSDSQTYTNMAFTSIAEPLSRYLSDETILHEAALLSLVNGAILLYLFAPRPSRDSSIPQTCFKLAASDHCPPTPHVRIIIALTAGTLRCKTPVNSTGKGLDSHSQSEEVIRQLIKVHSQDKVALKMISAFGLQTVATHPEFFHLEKVTQEIRETALNRAASLVNDFYDDFQAACSSDRWGSVQEDVVLSYLRAFHDSCELLPLGSMAACIPFFALVDICDYWYLPPSSPARAKREELLSTCDFPTLSSLLVWVLEAQDTISKLKKIMATEPRGRHALQKFIAAGQLWILFTLYLDSSDDTSDDRDRLGAQLRKYSDDGTQDEFSHRVSLGRQLEELWKELPQSSVPLKETWAARVMECVYESRDPQPPLPAWVRWNLRNVKQKIRGLASFTGRQPETGEPPAAKAEATKTKAEGDHTGADLIHAAHNQVATQNYDKVLGAEITEGKIERTGVTELTRTADDGGGMCLRDGTGDHQHRLGNDQKEEASKDNTSVRTECGKGEEGSQARGQDSSPEYAEESARGGPHIAVDIPGTDNPLK